MRGGGGPGGGPGGISPGGSPGICGILLSFVNVDVAEGGFNLQLQNKSELKKIIISRRYGHNFINQFQVIFNQNNRFLKKLSKKYI